MKNIFFLFLLIINAACHGQPDSLFSPNIYNDIAGTLYYGYENKLFLYMDGINSKEISVRPDKGEIRKFDHGHFLYYYNSNNDKETVTFNISCIDNAIIKSGEKTMTITKPPAPIVIAAIAGINHGSISKEQLLKYPVLTAVSYLENFPYEPELFEIEGFTLTLVIKEYIQEYPISGNIINTTPALNVFKYVISGQKLYFEDITAKGDKGTIKSLDSFYITIE